MDCGLLKQWGWQVEIEEFQVLMPTPKSRRLEMTAPTRFVATLAEPPVAADPTSSQQAEQLPSYNAYSADGDVTGRLVYVNYGRPQDYEVLDRLGVSVKGAIVIARYGGSWRGIKPKVAAEHGAIGCLIYSDPRDDGYFGGEVYPAGPMRNKDGVQRGSVMDMPVHPGDPLTPGVGATRDAEAPGRQGRADDHEDPGAADLVRRRAAAACGNYRPAGARGLARRAAHYVPHRPRRGDGPADSSHSTGPSRRSTTSSRGCLAPRWPTSGSCAATTTTPGSTAPRTR